MTHAARCAMLWSLMPAVLHAVLPAALPGIVCAPHAVVMHAVLTPVPRCRLWPVISGRRAAACLHPLLCCPSSPAAFVLLRVSAAPCPLLVFALRLPADCRPHSCLPCNPAAPPALATSTALRCAAPLPAPGRAAAPGAAPACPVLAGSPTSSAVCACELKPKGRAGLRQRCTAWWMGGGGWG